MKDKEYYEIKLKEEVEHILNNTDHRLPEFFVQKTVILG